MDYYAAAKGSFGLQIGAQQYAHALFFMTPEALEKFRRSSGWAVGADIRYASPEEGASIGKETTELNDVIALVFGQQGLIAGARWPGSSIPGSSPEGRPRAVTSSSPLKSRAWLWAFRICQSLPADGKVGASPTPPRRFGSGLAQGGQGSCLRREYFRKEQGDWTRVHFSRRIRLEVSLRPPPISCTSL